MPGRKSGDSIDDGPSEKHIEHSKKSKDEIGVEDLKLPRTIVQRLAKGVLPANSQIQSSALLAIQKSATVFVNYLASNANDRAILAGKKTIQPHDVLEALNDLEMPSFLPRCEGELQEYTTAHAEKRKERNKRTLDSEQAPKDLGSKQKTVSAHKGHRDDATGDHGALSNDDGSADEQLRMEVDRQDARRRKEGDEPSASKRLRMETEDEDEVEEMEEDEDEEADAEEDAEEDEEDNASVDENEDPEQSDEIDGNSDLDDNDHAKNRQRSRRGGRGDVEDIEDEEDSD